MRYDSTGTLKVNTYIAGDALPVPGALVRIYGIDELNREQEHSRITDENGNTGPISLPAPSALLTLDKTAKERPYALYDVQITLDGFYTKDIKDIAVFGGAETILPVNMIPKTESGVPRDTLYTTSRENPSLE